LIGERSDQIENACDEGRLQIKILSVRHTFDRSSMP
jgi:hypothetical protein